jgi:hypothetical protein
VVAFNTVEGWAHDVSEDVAREVIKRAAERDRSLDGLRRFLISYLGERTLAPADEYATRQKRLPQVGVP